MPVQFFCFRSNAVSKSDKNLGQFKSNRTNAGCDEFVLIKGLEEIRLHDGSD